MVFHYTGPMGLRSVMFRCLNDASIAPAFEAVSAVLVANMNLFANSVGFTNVDIYQEGQDYSNPAAWELLEGTNSSTLNPIEYPRFYSFVGRGLTGRRLRTFFYGMPGLTLQGDYRVTGSEVPALMDFRADLAALYSSGVLCDIAKSQVFLKAYANTGYNAYYQRKRRTEA
jgi:hypothetical protein